MAVFYKWNALSRQGNVFLEAERRRDHQSQVYAGMGEDMGVASYDKGSLTSYCAAWVDGSIHELGHDFVEIGRVEAAEGQDGYIEYTCTKCQEVKQEIIEAPENPDPEEPENPEGSGGSG